MNKKIMTWLIVGFFLVSFASAKDVTWFGVNESNPSQQIPVLLDPTGILKINIDFLNITAGNATIADTLNVDNINSRIGSGITFLDNIFSAFNISFGNGNFSSLTLNETTITDWSQAGFLNRTGTTLIPKNPGDSLNSSGDITFEGKVTLGFNKTSRVANGDFDAGNASWTCDGTSTTGNDSGDFFLTITGTGTTCQQDVGIVTGNIYKFSYNITGTGFWWADINIGGFFKQIQNTPTAEEVSFIAQSSANLSFGESVGFGGVVKAYDFQVYEITQSDIGDIKTERLIFSAMESSESLGITGENSLSMGEETSATSDYCFVGGVGSNCSGLGHGSFVWGRKQIIPPNIPTATAADCVVFGGNTCSATAGTVIGGNGHTVSGASGIGIGGDVFGSSGLALAGGASYKTGSLALGDCDARGVKSTCMGQGSGVGDNPDAGDQWFTNAWGNGVSVGTGGSPSQSLTALGQGCDFNNTESSVGICAKEVVAYFQKDEMIFQEDDNRVCMGTDGCNDSYESFDGTNKYYWVNNSTSIHYFEGNLSAENLIDRSVYWDSSLGSALESTYDTSTISSDEDLPDFERITYEVIDKENCWEEFERYEYCYTHIKGSERDGLGNITEERRVTQCVKEPYINWSEDPEVFSEEINNVTKKVCALKNETGRLISAVVGKHEQALSEINNVTKINQSEGLIIHDKILVNEIHTNTTKDVDTMSKIQTFRNTLIGKTLSQMESLVLTTEGELSDDILTNTEKSKYGSYDMGAVAHFNRAMVVLLMWENLKQDERIQELEDRNFQEDICWAKPTQTEIITCMRNL